MEGRPMSAQPNAARVNSAELETKVKAMYRDVAENPHGEFHFEMGRALAERLGYPPADLDAVPSDAIDSFAGVGYYFDLADLKAGEAVVDLGSGSGMDSFVAARKVGRTGAVIGIDMTDEQLAKAERLRAAAGFGNVSYRKGYIQATGVADASCDAVISNGVINLAPDKGAVFREAARVLKAGGRLALADIVTETQLPEGITCDATLWAACIGGAMQVGDYVSAIEAAGLRVKRVKDNPQYQFISRNALGATRKYGVKSVSLVAIKA
jgi:ubiquinone/menaquinone biosynthesis C-methylase UbiE